MHTLTSTITGKTADVAGLVTHVPDDLCRRQWHYADATWNRDFGTEAEAWGFAAAVRNGRASGFAENIDAGDLRVAIMENQSLALLDEDGDVTIRLPAGFPHDMIKHVAAAFEIGLGLGERRGKVSKQSEIRRVLGL